MAFEYKKIIWELKLWKKMKLDIFWLYQVKCIIIKTAFLFII